MLDIVTFGSVSWDIFVKPKNSKIISDKKFVTGKGVCFNLGSKVDIEEIEFNSGGGGTNTAATFSKQGFKVAYCGAMGDDLSGKEIIKELKKININTGLVVQKEEKYTNHSIVLNSGGKRDRTILVYRGASELLCDKDINWEKIKKAKPKWFYLAPLSGKLAALTEKIVDFARKNKIKVAINPGNSQLKIPTRKLKDILSKVDVLFLNQEEASLLTKIPYQKEEEIFKEIDKMCPGITIMTKGKRGVVVSDGKHIYSAKPLKIKVSDRTGAGDSFASGFISGLIKFEGSIEEAIQLGMANANSCLQKIGAKNGLLDKNEKFDKIKVRKYLVSSI